MKEKRGEMRGRGRKVDGATRKNERKGLVACIKNSRRAKKVAPLLNFTLKRDTIERFSGREREKQREIERRYLRQTRSLAYNYLRNIAGHYVNSR